MKMKSQAQLIDELKQTDGFIQAGLYEKASPAVKRVFDSAKAEGKKATFENQGGITVSGNHILSCYDEKGNLLCKGGRGLSMF